MYILKFIFSRLTLPCIFIFTMTVSTSAASQQSTQPDALHHNTLNKDDEKEVIKIIKRMLVRHDEIEELSDSIDARYERIRETLDIVLNMYENRGCYAKRSSLVLLNEELATLHNASLKDSVMRSALLAVIEEVTSDLKNNCSALYEIQ